MVRFAVELFLVASAATAMGQAVTACPWLASGTAATLLGGEVTVTAHVEGTFAGSCRFARPVSESLASIEILVGPADSHACPQDKVKLKAIGNEAVQCRRLDSPTRQSDMIAGRIRNVYFVVTMNNIAGDTKMEPGDPKLADAYGASALERVTEQVVGNLY
jgi:hypothetical protein